MKLDLNTLPTVPDDPPAAEVGAPATDATRPVVLAIDSASDAEGDVPRPMYSPVTEAISPAAAISPRLKCDSDPLLF